MTASSSDTAAAPLVLQCTSGSLRGRAIPVTDRGLLIGRAGDCDLQVDANTDVKVSGHHATIVNKAGTFHYTDVGSTNGSLVNGRPVAPNQPVALGHGSTIVLGEDAGEGTVGFTVALAGQSSAPAGNQLAVRCPHCAAEFAAPRNMMGRTINCESCGVAFEVPISAKLFSGGGAGVSGAGTAQSAPPMPQHGAPPAADASQGPGLIGKMRKAVSNFREKREVQDQLALVQTRLQATRTQAQEDAARLGRSAWENADQQALAELPGGAALLESQGQMAALETKIAELSQQLDQANQAREASAASWAKKTSSSAESLENKQSAYQSAADDLAQAEHAVREVVDVSLTDAKTLGPMIDALAQADPASTDLDADLAALAEAMDRAAEVVRAGQGELAKPLATQNKAHAKRDKAAEALTAAREAHQANEQAAAADRAEHDAACKQTQAQRDQAQRELEQIKSSLGPAFGELGQALVQQEGAGGVDPQDPDFAAAASSSYKRDELQQQSDQLNARLAAL